MRDRKRPETGKVVARLAVQPSGAKDHRISTIDAKGQEDYEKPLELHAKLKQKTPGEEACST